MLSWLWGKNKYWEARYSSLREDYDELLDSVCALQSAERKSKAYGVSVYITAYNKLMFIKDSQLNRRVRRKEGW